MTKDGWSAERRERWRDTADPIPAPPPPPVDDCLWRRHMVTSDCKSSSSWREANQGMDTRREGSKVKGQVQEDESSTMTSDTSQRGLQQPGTQIFAKHQSPQGQKLKKKKKRIYSVIHLKTGNSTNKQHYYRCHSIQHFTESSS